MTAHHILLVTILGLLPTASIHSATDDDSLEFAEKYLLHYGYLTQNDDGQKSAPLITSDSLKNYVRTFQEFAGLEVTGELDGETMRMMRTPRCGVKDMVHDESAVTRRKRYALQGSRWKVSTITYKISKYPR